MRKIEINGNVVVIENNVPVPPRESAPGRKKGNIRLLVEQLRAGESAFLPVTSKRMEAANLTDMGKKVGKKLSYRSENGGVRIFCVSEVGTAKVETVTFVPAKSNGAHQHVAW